MRFKITANVDTVVHTESVVKLLKKYAGESDIMVASYQNTMYVNVDGEDLENIKVIIDLLIPEVKSYFVEPIQ